MARQQTKNVSLNTTPTAVSLGAGEIANLDIFNAANATGFVQLFDSAVGTVPTLGTTLPTRVIGLPTITGYQSSDAYNPTSNTGKTYSALSGNWYAAITTTPTGSSPMSAACPMSYDAIIP